VLLVFCFLDAIVIAITSLFLLMSKTKIKYPILNQTLVKIQSSRTHLHVFIVPVNGESIQNFRTWQF